MLGRQHVVDTADGGIVRGRLHLFGIILGLLSYLAHHSDETVDGLLRLVLRRLNHQALVEKKGEIDGGGVVAVVKQTLDEFIRIMRVIAQEAKDDPEMVKTAPHNTPVRRLDDTQAALHPIVTWRELVADNQ